MIYNEKKSVFRFTIFFRLHLLATLSKTDFDVPHIVLLHSVSPEGDGSRKNFNLHRQLFRQIQWRHIWTYNMIWLSVEWAYQQYTKKVEKFFYLQVRWRTLVATFCRCAIQHTHTTLSILEIRLILKLSTDVYSGRGKVFVSCQQQRFHLLSYRDAVSPSLFSPHTRLALLSTVNCEHDDEAMSVSKWKKKLFWWGLQHFFYYPNTSLPINFCIV